MIRLALSLSILAGVADAQTRPLARPNDLGQVQVPAPPTAEGAAPAQILQGFTNREAVAEQLRMRLQACWNVGSLSPEGQAVAIVVGFELTPDAVPIPETIRLINFSRGTQSAADEALSAASRAILRCGRDGLNLPSDLYGSWQRVEVTFDASSVAIR